MRKRSGSCAQYTPRQSNSDPGVFWSAQYSGNGLQAVTWLQTVACLAGAVRSSGTAATAMADVADAMPYVLPYIGEEDQRLS
jgi:hypothetical protein